MTLTSAVGILPSLSLSAGGNGRSAQELAEIAEEGQRALDGASAEAVIEWAVETFGERFCVTSSFADGVLAHVAGRVAPGVEVVFLDTGLHFDETLQVRDQVRATIPVTVVSVSPALTVGQQDAQYGPRLFNRSPDECCAMRKVEPLERTLASYDSWAAGLRRADGPSRAGVREVTFEATRGKVKVAPLARWSDEDVEEYIRRYDVPVNPLLSQGYASVGCWPCTRRTREGEDIRGGRWAIFDKTECGLHA